jgi:hypothetical protein
MISEIRGRCGVSRTGTRAVRLKPHRREWPSDVSVLVCKKPSPRFVEMIPGDRTETRKFSFKFPLVRRGAFVQTLYIMVQKHYSAYKGGHSY